MIPPSLQFGIPGAVELLIVLFVFGLSIIVPLAIAFLIYRDAKDRNSGHALAWGLGAFFGNLVVWILYFVVRDEVGAATPS